MMLQMIPAGDVDDGVRLLLRDAAAGRLAGVSGRTWRQWVQDGTAPPPVATPGLLRWSRSDVELWVSVGCDMGKFHIAKGKAAKRP